MAPDRTVTCDSRSPNRLFISQPQGGTRVNGKPANFTQARLPGTPGIAAILRYPGTRVRHTRKRPY
eukprot:3652497-Rhodomonas_salina.1